MSKLYVDEITPKTSGTTITFPAGMIVGAEVKEITAESTRSSATSFADDLDFGSYTPKLTNSTVLIQGVANMDSANSAYCYIKWIVDGTAYVTDGSLRTHGFYSGTSLNAHGAVPSTIITSVSNTDGSAISVKCQGSTSTGTLYVNRTATDSGTGSPSSVMFIEVAN